MWKRMKLSILCIVLLCSVIYAQQTREDILHYIEVELYDELLNISLSDAILDIINAAIADDWESLSTILSYTEGLNNNAQLNAAIELAMSDKEVRSALKRTAIKALRKKWSSLFK